jgi:hypothetical protein
MAMESSALSSVNNCNYHVYWTDCFPGLKGKTVITVRKGIPNNHIDLPSLALIETICISIGSSEVLLAAVYNLQVEPGVTSLTS